MLQTAYYYANIAVLVGAALLELLLKLLEVLLGATT